MTRRRRRKRDRKPYFNVKAAENALWLGPEASAEEFASDPQIRLLIKLGVEQSKAAQMTKHEAHRVIDRIKSQQAEKKKSQKKGFKSVWQKAAEKN